MDRLMTNRPTTRHGFPALAALLLLAAGCGETPAAKVDAGTSVQDIEDPSDVPAADVPDTKDTKDIKPDVTKDLGPDTACTDQACDATDADTTDDDVATDEDVTDEDALELDSDDALLDTDEPDVQETPDVPDVLAEIADGTCPNIPADLPAGTLIVSEVMIKPAAVGDEFGEWFEIQNTSDVAIPLNNLLITDQNGVEEHSVNQCTLLIQAKGVVVFGRNGDPTLNGGVKIDYVYDDITLTNNGDSLVLKAGGQQLDKIAWNLLWPMAALTGHSANLDPDHFNSADNDDPSFWCPSKTALKDGDFGTPGATNPFCPKPPDEDKDGVPDDKDNCVTSANKDQKDADGDGNGDVCDNCMQTPNGDQKDLDNDGKGDACDGQVCSDAELDLGEQCDDGNSNENDGCTSACQIAAIIPSKVVISEILVHSDNVDDVYDEWIELFNGDTKPVTINGWTVKTGLGGTANLPDSPTLTIPANGYFLLGASSDKSANGGLPVDWAWKKALLLEDTDDTVEIWNKSLLVDKIHYGAGTPPTKSSVALQVDPKYMTAAYNDDPAYWCHADNLLVLSGDTGTPGKANTTCIPTGKDKDADGVVNEKDNCVFQANPSQQDSDLDGLGDPCDNCPILSNKAQSDGDADAVGDVCDNCAQYPNTDQKDSNKNGFGDACDSVTCANGNVELFEQCDDGNVLPGDGCSVNCQVESVIPGSVIITEFLAIPKSVGDATGEWFELYNITEATIDLNGWELADLGGQSHKILAPAGLKILPKGYLLLAGNGDAALNGGTTPDYVYSGYGLSNLKDQITLKWNNQVIDSVDYIKSTSAGDGKFEVVAGQSCSLDPGLLNSDYNNEAPNWCLGKKLWIGSKGDMGSPGKANASCTNPCKDANKNNKPDQTACGVDPDQWCLTGECVVKPFCSDGKVNPELGEVCDDGNKLPGDGCDPTCKPEPVPAAPGTLVISEIMPDPDSVNDEKGEWFEVYNPTKVAIDMTGWHFADATYPAPNADNHLITPACGNSRTEASEKCDDGNVVSGDGCSSTCDVEGVCKSLILDGKGAFVGVTPTTALPFANILTLHGWFLLDAAAPTGTCATLDGPVPCSELFAYGTAGKYEVGARVMGGHFFAVAGAQTLDLGPAVTGKWTHIALEIDNGKLRGFVSGRKTAEVKLTAGSYPPAQASADTITLGAVQDASTGAALHPFKGRMASFQVTTAFNGRFLHSFGPQVSWLLPAKGDVISLQMDEGVGVNLVDGSGNSHKAATTAGASWAANTNGNASGPYCKVSGALLPETTVLTPGSDCYLVQPGAYVLIARLGNVSQNNNLDTFYAWIDNPAAGYFLLSNDNDSVGLINPAGKVIDMVSYSKSWPWATAFSMMTKDGCLDATQNDQPGCWSSPLASCTYGNNPNFTSTFTPCSPTKGCKVGEVCYEFPDGKKCVMFDHGTPGAANLCL